MAKLNNDWWNTFQGDFETEEDVVPFIFERLNTNDFQDSYCDIAGYSDPCEMQKYSAEDKRNALYDFLIYLVERKVT